MTSPESTAYRQGKLMAAMVETSAQEEKDGSLAWRLWWGEGEVLAVGVQDNALPMARVAAMGGRRQPTSSCTGASILAAA